MEQTITWLNAIPRFLNDADSLSGVYYELFLVVLITGAAAIPAVRLALRILEVRRLLKQAAVFLELTPPAQTARTPEATQKLFAVLHGLHASRSFVDRLLRRKVVFSLEVVSSREDGIRYVMRVPHAQAEFFEQTIVSYLPSVRTRRIEDYLPNTLNPGDAKVLEFKQAGHFAYPLQTQSSILATDPMAYLMGMMTKLANNELVAFQLVVSPARVRKAEAIAQRLLNNEELLYRLGKGYVPVAQGALNILSTILLGIVDAISSIFNSSSGPGSYSNRQRELAYQHDVAARIKPARVFTAFEQELAESVNDKVSQQLYRASIRTIIHVNNEAMNTQRVETVKSALAVFSIPGYQALRARHDFPNYITKRYRMYVFRHRLLNLLGGKTGILSASELATMFHFPLSGNDGTENVVTSLSKALPATIDLKRHADMGNFDVVLGRNVYHGAVTDIGLTAAERERHVYVIGGTGNGKTTMLQYGIVQDIQNGKGVAVIDPHGDMAKTLLKYIPEERIDDVIYFNPRDVDYPIGLNLLELPPGLSGSDLAMEKDRVTESVVSVLRKIFSEDDSGGHRIEYVLRNTIHTAMTIEGATIFTVLRLLTDSTYRKVAIRTLKDDYLKRFWNEEIGKAGDMQRVKMSAGVTNKLGRFQSSIAAQRMLGQKKSTINFDDILNSGKILICNLSKGAIGEDTSSLFGTAILTQLQMAAWRREEMEPEHRRPFYIYVDEFQNFATTTFVQLLSEARKYRVFVTMAEQSTAQQEDQRMVETILNNVGTVVCFRTGSPADERLMLPRFSPYVEEGEILNLPTYNFYARLSAVKPHEPVSGETVLQRGAGNKEVAERVISASRSNYAVWFGAQGSSVSEGMVTKEAKARAAKARVKSQYIPAKKRLS
jgi:hypothetical protein